MPLLNIKTADKIESLEVYEDIPFNLHEAENSVIKSISIVEKENKAKTGINEYFRLVVDHKGKELTFEVYKGVKGKAQYSNSLDVIANWIDSQHDEIQMKVAGKTIYIKPSNETDYWIGKQITIAKVENRYGFEPIFHLPKPSRDTKFDVEIVASTPTPMPAPKAPMLPPKPSVDTSAYDKWLRVVTQVRLSGEFKTLYDWFISRSKPYLVDPDRRVVIPCGETLNSKQARYLDDLWNIQHIENIFSYNLNERDTPELPELPPSTIQVGE